MKRILPALAVALALATAAGAAIAVESPALAGTRAASGVEVYIIAPADGATVGQQVVVRFGLKGMGVAPAGVVREHTGHHHLLVDVKELPPAGLPIASDEHHIHFGGGQTETTLTLKPGVHTLQLELGDASHIPFDPAVVSKKITIHVK